MTESEAIRDLDIIRFNPHWDELVNEEYWQELMEMAIKALEEVQKYRAIGTPEECRAAVEKQTAKKPDYEGDGYADGHLVYDTWICPCCGKHYEVDYDNYNYCPDCGQKLDWSDEE
ncbi:hypothetical protein WMO43_02310 [Lachnospiraceae bacterium CLA-AA-H185]|jgi:rubrerythrin|uniref:Uncharacterized protein n=1 Tax=Maccoyibacter intestinihominis TaxID=3133499 RepID=A0ABV1HAJ7_9FIRM